MNGKKLPLVRELMTPSPVRVGPEDSLQAAFDLLWKYKINELPVVNRGVVVGIVTDRDLKQVAPSYPLFLDEEEIAYHLQSLKVAEAMTPEPIVIGPDASLVEAAKLLRAHRIGSLPVVEAGHLLGVVSVTDVLGAFIQAEGG
jgi:acetoin utilization protein AcuB